MEQINKMAEPVPLGSILDQVVSLVKVESTQDSPNAELQKQNSFDSPRLRRIDLLGLPRVLKGKNLGSLIGYEKQKTAALNALNAGRSILISGACGRGKSHMAYGLMGIWFRSHEFLTAEELTNASIQSHLESYTARRLRFLPAVELFHELKMTFRDNAEITEDEIITKYTVDDLLVIDDIGAEKISEWSRQVFYLLVDRRYRDCRQTIFTSNLNLENISALVDDRIASRLAECEVIELKGEDWRLK